MNDFTQKFISIFSANFLGRFADEKTALCFQALTERMLEVNEHMNLTAITDTDGIILKHYADSLTASEYIPDGASVIDIGCGAGFPSLPLAIARPDLHITALDSTAKRINYISETAHLLGLGNITAVSGRAEELAKNLSYREKYDFACARAVARLNVLCELCLPYVKVGGHFLAMKANADEELAEAGNAISLPGGKLERAERIGLISSGGEANPRTLILIKKISPTPKNYPRNNSQISKKPL